MGNHKIKFPAESELAEIAVLNTPAKILLETVEKHFPEAFEAADYFITELYRKAFTYQISTKKDA